MSTPAEAAHLEAAEAAAEAAMLDGVELPALPDDAALQEPAAAAGQEEDDTG
jgi:hypothetical protein